MSRERKEAGLPWKEEVEKSEDHGTSWGATASRLSRGAVAPVKGQVVRDVRTDNPCVTLLPASCDPAATRGLCYTSR